MKQKLPFFLEILWLIVMIFSLSAALYKTMQVGLKQSLILYLIAFLATLMYFSRRYLRKTRDRIDSNKK